MLCARALVKKRRMVVTKSICEMHIQHTRIKLPKSEKCAKQLHNKRQSSQKWGKFQRVWLLLAQFLRILSSVNLLEVRALEVRKRFT